MGYNSKYSGKQVDEILDKANALANISVDDSLSSESENPVQNKVITSSLDDIVKRLENIKGDGTITWIDVQ